MKFVKMHGCGNDYVYLDAVTTPEIERLIDEPGWVERVRRMSDRHKGIGSDGVIVVCRPTEFGRLEHAQVRMRMFNRDGSESEMCGNGVRCVAKLAHDRLGVRANPVHVETGRGVLGIHYTTRNGQLVDASVNMGSPIMQLDAIPVDRNHLVKVDSHEEWGIRVDGTVVRVFLVSMGNPHAVTFVDDVDSVDLATLGPLVESHPAFPNRVNYHIAQGLRETKPGQFSEVKVRTWERGAGLTQACGTGVCAVFVAGKRLGMWFPPLDSWNRAVLVQVPGGRLHVHGDGGEGLPWSIVLTGEAVEVYEGDWPA